MSTTPSSIRAGWVLPGVVDALAAVGGLDGVVQSVLTGNLRPIAETKPAAGASVVLPDLTDTHALIEAIRVTSHAFSG